MEDDQVRLMMEHLHSQVINSAACIVQLYVLTLPIRNSLSGERLEAFNTDLKEFQGRVDKMLTSLDEWRKRFG